MGKLFRPDAKTRIRMAKRYVNTNHTKSKIVRDAGFKNLSSLDTAIKHALKGGHITEQDVLNADARRASKNKRRLIVTKPLTLVPKSLLPTPVHDYLFTDKKVSQIALEAGLKSSKEVIGWTKRLRDRQIIRDEHIVDAQKRQRTKDPDPGSTRIGAKIKLGDTEISGSVEIQRAERKKPGSDKPEPQKESPTYPEPRVKNMPPMVYDVLYSQEPFRKIMLKHGFDSAINFLNTARERTLSQSPRKKTRKKTKK